MLRDLAEPLPRGRAELARPRVVDRIRDSSTTIGVVAAVGAIWIGASFWGAMDTAFCRIYHVECRGWVEQKRFALVMLLVVILFLAASVVIPVAEGALASGAEDLPVRPRRGRRPARARSSCCAALVAHLRGLRADLLRRAQGPRAVARGLAGGAVRHRDHGDRQRGLPLLPRPVERRRSSAARSASSSSPWSGSTSSASALLAGAVINALRFELHDTGSVEEERARAFAEPD